MIQRLARKHDPISLLLAKSFAAMGIDFYKEIAGPDWGFYYSRSQWMGLPIDEEGKELVINFGGVNDIYDSLRKHGWGLYPVIKKEDLFTSRVIIGLTLPGSWLRNWRGIPKNMSKELLYVYHCMEHTFEFYDMHNGETIYQGRAEPDEFAEAVHLDNYMRPQYKLIFEEADPKRNNDDLLKQWKNNMNLYTCGQPFQGLYAMVRLYCDIRRFSMHGHKEWMEEWALWMKQQFGYVYFQRLGSYRYAEEEGVFTKEKKRQFYQCIQQWKNFMEEIDSTLDLNILCGAYKHIVTSEMRIFDIEVKE